MKTPTCSIPKDLLSEMVDKSLWAQAIFSGENFELLHWNSAFAHWIDHKTATLPEHLRLPDLLAPNCRAEFHRSTLSHAKVFGAWEGPLTMLTQWGEPFQAYACIISFRPCTGEDLCALIASTGHLTAPSAESANISDHELLHALLETVPMAIYFKDLKSRFIRVSNYQAKRHNFADSNEMVGLSDFDIFSLEHAQPAFTSEQAIIATGQALIDIEERETYTDQADTWVSTSKFPLTNRAGQVVGTFGLSKDVTVQHFLAKEQRRISEELARAQKRDILSGKLPRELHPKNQAAIENARNMQRAFEQLIPHWTAYRQLVECHQTGGDPGAALQQIQSLEHANPPEQLLLQLLENIKGNIGDLLQMQTLLETLTQEYTNLARGGEHATPVDSSGSAPTAS